MADKTLQLVLVTPEKTLLDVPTQSLSFPLFDGQIGVLPSRAPMVGRLGFGELKIHTTSGESKYYIDGGFVQIKDNVVSLLTNDATPLDQLNKTALKAELEELSSGLTRTELEYETKSGRQARVRKMLSLAQ
ncbi:MAG TPA: F0F1 ATP synthase subunit epsilon [Planctomycetaceae bacterium]|nr:F0F1 ATP synthase subunit epsilon [Planctomycetaceae bacterium]